MSAPLERITAFHAGPFVGLFVGTMEVGSNCAQFVRADLYDAAIAAARAEGVREGMLKAADIASAFASEGKWADGFIMAADIAAAIRAAAEAQP